MTKLSEDEQLSEDERKKRLEANIALVDKLCELPRNKVVERFSRAYFKAMRRKRRRGA